MKLTTTQLALLNNLTYTNDPAATGGFPSVYEFEGSDLSAYVKAYRSFLPDPAAFGSSFTSGSEWKQVVEAIACDGELSSLRISSVLEDPLSDARALILTAPDNSEAVVAFRGTGGGEWADNFQGGGPTDGEDGVSTAQQQQALGWYRQQYGSLGLDRYDTVTVTGHSKGGNKAQYITLLDDSADRCVSFDGQGFSDEFIDRYAVRIAGNSSKIENHCAEGDYVSILLSSVGTMHYHRVNAGISDKGGFLENHCPNSYLFFDEKGAASMKPGEQDGRVRELDRFFNSFLRTLSPDQKRVSLNLIGEIAQDGFSGRMSGDPERMAARYLDTPQKREAAASLIAYCAAYSGKYPDFGKAVNSLISDMPADSGVKSMLPVLIGAVSSAPLRETAANLMYYAGKKGTDINAAGAFTISDLIYLALLKSGGMKGMKMPDGRDKGIQYISSAGGALLEPERIVKTGSSDAVSDKNFEAAPDVLAGCARSMLGTAERIEGLVFKAGECARSLSGSASYVGPGLKGCIKRLSAEKRLVAESAGALDMISRLYKRAEKRALCGPAAV